MIPHKFGLVILLSLVTAAAYAQSELKPRRLTACDAISFKSTPRLESQLEHLGASYEDLLSFREESRDEIARSRQVRGITLQSSYDILVGDDISFESQMEILRRGYAENLQIPFNAAELASLLWLATLHGQEIPREIVNQVIGKYDEDFSASWDENAAFVLAKGIWLSDFLTPNDFTSFVRTIPDAPDTARFIKGFLLYHSGRQYKDRSQLAESVSMLEQLSSNVDSVLCNSTVTGIADYLEAKGRLMLAQLIKDDRPARTTELWKARLLIESARKELDPIVVPKLWAEAHIVSGDIYNEVISDAYLPDPKVPYLSKLRDRSYALANLYKRK